MTGFIKLLILGFLFCSGLYVHAVSCADLFRNKKKQEKDHNDSKPTQSVLTRVTKYVEDKLFPSLSPNHSEYTLRALAHADLKPNDIKGSVILGVGRFHSTGVVYYTLRKIGAGKVFFVTTNRQRSVTRYLLPIDPSLMQSTHITDKVIPAFNSEVIRKRLGGSYADITLSLGAIGRLDLKQAELWLRQLIEATKNEGIIILDFKYYIDDFNDFNEKSSSHISLQEFQDVLSLMGVKLPKKIIDEMSQEKFQELLLSAVAFTKTTDRISRQEFEELLIKMKVKGVIKSYKGWYITEGDGLMDSFIIYKIKIASSPLYEY